jgi:hypothetical protein
MAWEDEREREESHCQLGERKKMKSEIYILGPISNKYLFECNYQFALSLNVLNLTLILIRNKLTSQYKYFPFRLLSLNLILWHNRLVVFRYRLAGYYNSNYTL